MIKKWLTISNLFSGLVLAVVLMLALNHYSKSLVLRGLMDIGFYQPKLTQPVKNSDPKDLIPNLNFKSSDGRVINLADQKGKVVFIDFWATWCPYCVAELPAINDLCLKLKPNPGIVFIMIDVDNNLGKSTQFMAKHQYSLPVYTLSGNIPANLTDGTTPTTFIVDKRGYIVYRHKGTADYSNPKMLAYLDQLVSAK